MAPTTVKYGVAEFTPPRQISSSTVQGLGTVWEDFMYSLAYLLIFATAARATE